MLQVRAFFIEVAYYFIDGCAVDDITDCPERPFYNLAYLRNEWLCNQDLIFFLVLCILCATGAHNILLQLFDIPTRYFILALYDKRWIPSHPVSDGFHQSLQ